jgi:rRNA maturation endonuclease Nob1
MTLFTTYKTQQAMKPEEISYIKQHMGAMRYVHGQAYNIMQSATKTIFRVADEVLKDPRVKELISKYPLSIDTEFSRTESLSRQVLMLLHEVDGSTGDLGQAPNVAMGVVSTNQMINPLMQCTQCKKKYKGKKCPFCGKWNPYKEIK